MVMMFQMISSVCVACALYHHLDFNLGALHVRLQQLWGPDRSRLHYMCNAIYAMVSTTSSGACCIVFKLLIRLLRTAPHL